MTNATITLSGEGINELNGIDLHIAVEAVVNIDAKSARKKATAWLASEVGNMLLAGQPKLVIDQRTVWRLPALLTSSERGIMGEVGSVDVDASSGKLLVDENLRTQLLNNVQQLISPPLSANR